MYVYTYIEPPPFQARSFSATSLYVLSIYHLILEVKKCLSFPSTFPQQFAYYFFLVPITSLRPCKNDIRATAGRYEKKTADLLT